MSVEAPLVVAAMLAALLLRRTRVFLGVLAAAMALNVAKARRRSAFPEFREHL